VIELGAEPIGGHHAVPRGPAARLPRKHVSCLRPKEVTSGDCQKIRSRTGHEWIPSRERVQDLIAVILSPVRREHPRIGQRDRREDFAANPPRRLYGDTDIAERYLFRHIVQRHESDWNTFSQSAAAQLRPPDLRSA